jgi:hypothetical protein
MQYAKKAQAIQTEEELRVLFATQKIAMRDDQAVLDTEKGTATLDDLVFTYIDSRLRLMGYCPLCAAYVHSKPIRRFADLASYGTRFIPDTHECLIP